MRRQGAMPPASDPLRNRLLAALPPEEWQRCKPKPELVKLSLGEVLSEAGGMQSHVYFPTMSFVSLICAVDHHPAREVGMAGSEGRLGTELLLGVSRSPFDVVVQGAGAVAVRATAPP